MSETLVLYKNISLELKDVEINIIATLIDFSVLSCRGYSGWSAAMK